MAEARGPEGITIRQAAPHDTEGIVRIFLESAGYHALLDPERYWLPAAEKVLARYKGGRHDPQQANAEAITLVAELDGGVVGFIDARLDRSQDIMHRELLFCQVEEIAVGQFHQSRGIGGQLLQAAEDWGRRLGADFALLEYHAANARASAFYRERMGYQAAAITAIKRL